MMAFRRRKSPSGRAMGGKMLRGLWLILVVLCGGMWIIIGERMDSALDGSLDELLESLVEYAAPTVLAEIDAASSPGREQDRLSFFGRETYFEAYAEGSGKILARSPSLKRGQNLLGHYALKKARKRDDGWNIRIKDRPIRCLAHEIKIPGMTGRDPEKALLIVGLDRIQADRRWKEIMIRSGAALFLLLLTAGFGVWLVVERATKPLRQLVHEVSLIKPEKIKPVSVPQEPDLAILAKRVNTSLEAVARHVEKERRFSGDVAHELYTPIGGLRAVVDVALHRARPEPELRSALEQCGAIAVQMQDLVANLLNLSRLEAGAFDAAHEEISLADLLNAIWSDLEPRASLRNVSFENQVPPALIVSAPPALLSIILANLLSNAARYARPSSRIGAAIGVMDTSIKLRISNETESVPRDLASKAFDRFWRSDSSRNRTGLPPGEGSGLGLSLARAAADAMQQQLDLEILDGNTVCATVTLQRVGGFL